jgi:hypothetical protein
MGFSTGSSWECYHGTWINAHFKMFTQIIKIEYYLDETDFIFSITRSVQIFRDIRSNVVEFRSIQIVQQNILGAVVARQKNCESPIGVVFDLKNTSSGKSIAFIGDFLLRKSELRG